MKLLLDTNIVIPLEPTSTADIKLDTAVVVQIFRRAQRVKAELFYHPAIREDFARDTDELRRRAREMLIEKYLPLPSPPSITTKIAALIGEADVGSNDWVDDQLLVAVARNAVDYLVTNDKRIHRKAKRLEIADRVLGTSDAIQMLGAWLEESSPAPPALRRGLVHELDETDPFFTSLAADYGGEKFYAWLDKAKRAHRDCWTTRSPNSRLEALLIVKQETDSVPLELNGLGKVLKICTFKVATEARGAGLGEQLLKACFNHCYQSKYEACFVTLFEDRQPELRDLLVDFGFQKSAQLSTEAVMFKRFGGALDLNGLSAHIMYGPRYIDWRQPVYVVPVQPRFCELLFPEKSEQANLLAARSTSANGIRKFYLCNASLKSLPIGAVLLFYRSQQKPGVIAVGVVDGVARSQQPEEILRLAGRRTVFSMRDIRRLVGLHSEEREGGDSDAPAVKRRSVLAIGFRESRLPREHISLRELKEHNLLKSAPQSITKCVLTEESTTWLDKRTRE